MPIQLKCVYHIFKILISQYFRNCEAVWSILSPQCNKSVQTNQFWFYVGEILSVWRNTMRKCAEKYNKKVWEIWWESVWKYFLVWEKYCLTLHGDVCSVHPNRLPLCIQGARSWHTPTPLATCNYQHYQHYQHYQDTFNILQCHLQRH